MPVPSCPDTGTPSAGPKRGLRSNRKYARLLVRTSSGGTRARSLAFRSERHCTNSATVRYQKTLRGRGPEGRDEDKQNAARGSPPTHQATRIFALGEEGSPRDERRSTGCALRRRWRVSTLAGRRRPPGRPAQARLLRRCCRSDCERTSARPARGPGASVGTDVRYAAAPAAFDVSEP